MQGAYCRDKDFSLVVCWIRFRGKSGIHWLELFFSSRRECAYIRMMVLLAFYSL